MSKSIPLWVVMKAVDKKIGPSPCNGCQERYPGCGSDCKRGFKEWQEARRAERQAYLKKESGAIAADKFRQESRDASMQKKRMTVKMR